MAKFLQHIRPWHKTVMRLQHAGMKAKEIAVSIGRHPGTISKLINDPTYIELYSSWEAALDEKILDPSNMCKEASPEAVETLIDHMRGPDPNLSRLSANDILDRAGFGRQSKVQHGGLPNLQISASQVNLLLTALRESEPDLELPKPILELQEAALKDAPQ